MAIQRWEMLLSAQADSFLLKIQGDRNDVDQIVRAHPQTCQNVQEISDDVFQWAIFVVDAPLPEKLAIQNQVMSLTKDTSGEGPSGELLDILDGLSGALQDLTNLTEDEQTFVMNKMARMGNPVPSAPLGPPPPTPNAPASNGQQPGSPPKVPGPGSPLPRVTIPGKPGSPVTPFPTANPQPIPTPLNRPPMGPKGGTPLPSPGPLPNIVRPVQPPRTGSGGPPLPGAPTGNAPRLPNPMPSIPMPKISPPMNVSKKAELSSPPLPGTPVKPVPQPPQQLNENSMPIPMTPSEPQSLNSMPIPNNEKVIESPSIKEETLSQRPKTLFASTPPKVYEEPPPINPVQPLAFTSPLPPPKSEGFTAEQPCNPAPTRTPAPSGITDDSSVLRVSLFYSTGGEASRDRFMTTLTEIAQKKSRKPTTFIINASVATSITLDNSAEWIWKAKTSGSDIFFVVLPPGLGSDLMDPLVGEAHAAGLRCFLIPDAEIDSKLLYMDLMVELMMFKRRVRPTA